jgi:hypothetical protein
VLWQHYTEPELLGHIQYNAACYLACRSPSETEGAAPQRTLVHVIVHLRQILHAQHLVVRLDLAVGRDLQGLEGILAVADVGADQPLGVEYREAVLRC